MSGEYTGKATTINAIPKMVSGSVDQSTWEQRAKEGGWFVQFDGATSTADEIGVAFLATNTATVVGRLVGTTGDGDDFRVSIETVGRRGFAQGGGSGALGTADYGIYCKGDANGKLVLDTALTVGNVNVTGGTKSELYVAWIWPYGKG